MTQEWANLLLSVPFLASKQFYSHNLYFRTKRENFETYDEEKNLEETKKEARAQATLDYAQRLPYTEISRGQLKRELAE